MVAAKCFCCGDPLKPGGSRACSVLLFIICCPKNATVKEYSVNVASGELVITFSPSTNSFAYINALEVVSVPDSLITDDAALFNPSGAFSGLVAQSFETVATLNMGGLFVSLANDTLGRTWVPDRSFLAQPNLETNASNILSVSYPDGGATSDSAPQTVYGITISLQDQSRTNITTNLNMIKSEVNGENSSTLM